MRYPIPRNEHHLICPKCGKALDKTDCVMNHERYCEGK